MTKSKFPAFPPFKPMKKTSFSDPYSETKRDDMIIVEKAQDATRALIYLMTIHDQDGYEMIREEDLQDLAPYLDVSGLWVAVNDEGRRSLRVWSKKSGKITDYKQHSWYHLVLIRYPKESEIEWVHIREKTTIRTPQTEIYRA